MIRRIPHIRRPSGRTDLPSLEERFGYLLLVRLGLALAVLLGAAAASPQVGLTFGQALAPTVLFVAVTAVAELLASTGRRAALAAYRLMVPLDAVYLVLMTAPAGGPRSQLIVLFYLHLVAVTLLGSARSALRLALWDTFLFIAVASLGLTSRIGELLGVRAVIEPLAADTALAIMGFWAIAVCTAVFSSVSERELRRNRNELESLTQMSAALETTEDPATARELLLSYTTGTLGFKRGLLIPSTGDALVAVAAGKRQPADVVRAKRPASPDGIVGRAHVEAVHGGVLALRQLDPTSDPFASQLMPHARNVVVLAVGSGADSPVLIVEHGGRVTGERLARRTILMAQQFVSHGGLALASIATLADKARLAAVDGLTGLANRRQFDQALAREVATATRRGDPLTLVLIDIDHFKAINDTEGHLVGDEVLRELGKVLQDACRDMDLVARYGGEEFALILPTCGPDEALGVLSRVDQSIRGADNLRGITVSSGVATLPQHAVDDAGLIAAADMALYASKHAGRNRATVAEEPVTVPDLGH